MDIKYDICSSQLVNNFKYNNSYNLDNLDNLFNQFFDKYNYDLCIVDHNDSKKIATLDECHIGDIIKITYIPFSQKYMDYYDSHYVCGKIIYIDLINDDALIYRDEFIDGRYIRHIMSISRLGCSYYGDSKAYDYFIYKYK
jgi:hypothetical protein